MNMTRAQLRTMPFGRASVRLDEKP